MNKREKKKNTRWEATIARNNQRTIRRHGGKAESVEMNGYKWKGGDGGEIINDIRRSYNLYKRPRFQTERNIQVVLQTVSSGGSIPGAQRLRVHPTSHSRNVKSRMFVVPAL